MNKRRRQKQNPKYKIQAASKTAPASILIYDFIDSMFGISAEMVVRDLDKLSGESSIDLRIKSNGGDIFEGFSIFNALMAHPSDINVFIEPLAASAASFIAMAGDQITMQETGGVFHMHKSHGFKSGNATDHEIFAHRLTEMDEFQAKIYATRNRDDDATESEMMTMLTGDAGVDGTFMDAFEAKDKGFVDEVIELQDSIAARLDPARFSGNIPDKFKPFAMTDNQSRFQKVRRFLEAAG